MKHTIDCEWRQGMQFETTVGTHRIRLDASRDHGGEDTGAPPKPLILSALAGCTGMDVIMILRKMHQEPEFFNVKVCGELGNEEPKTYTSFHIRYEFLKDDALDRTRVERAVQLSHDKYCGVSALLKKAGPVTHEIVYLDARP